MTSYDYFSIDSSGVDSSTIDTGLPTTVTYLNRSEGAPLVPKPSARQSDAIVIDSSIVAVDSPAPVP